MAEQDGVAWRNQLFRTCTQLSIAKGFAEAIIQTADEVTVGRTARDAGDSVNIKFKDGTVAYIRVENHPPRGRHANVQVWKPGEDAVNKHIDP